MQSISDTIERLRKLRSAHGSAPMLQDRLTDLRVYPDPGTSHEPTANTSHAPYASEQGMGIQRTIEKALRAAGLMK